MRWIGLGVGLVLLASLAACAADEVRDVVGTALATRAGTGAEMTTEANASASPSPPPPDGQDATVKPIPSLAQPAVGAWIADPTFGTPILRVTDARTVPGTVEMQSSSNDSPFNATGNRFFVHADRPGGAWLYAIDPATHTVTRLRSLAGLGIGVDGASWHPTDPTKLYGTDGGRRLYEITFAPSGAFTRTVLKNYAAEIPGTGSSSGRVAVTPNGDTFVVCAARAGGQDQYSDLLVWSRTEGTKRIWPIPTATGHNCSLTRDGLTAIVTVQSAPMQVLDLATGAVVEIRTSQPPYMGGHLSPGVGMIHYPDTASVPSSFYRRERASGWTVPVLTAARPGGSWSCDSHGTATLADGSFITASECTDVSGAWPPFQNEIAQIFPNRTWRRLAHHRSVFGGSLDWTKLVRPGVDPTGTYVLFTSTWGGTRPDAYLLRLK